MSNFWPIVFLIVVGIMLANAIAHPAGTKAVFDGIGGLWKTSVNGLLGQASSSSTPKAVLV